MKTDNLKLRTIHALFWSFFERIGQQGIQFISGIILARLLLPEEFGLIAMTTIFIAIAQTFIDSGFAKALIQKQKTTYLDECSIFYFNIFIGFSAAGLLCLIAPWIAFFYDQPLLTPLIYVLSLNLILNAFSLVQKTLLIKQINFRAQLKVSVCATFFSGIIGITMAYNGFGVWSLVTQSLSNSLCCTILFWILNKWRPSLIFSFLSLREMFVFGSRMLASGLLDTFFDNIYLVVIGKFYSPLSLGFYSRAQKLQQLPVSTISGVVSRVTFPVFSSIQKNKLRLKNGVRKSLSMLVLINFPIMVGLSIVAKPLILVLLTEKWIFCAPYLHLFCLIGLVSPLQMVNLNVLIAQGYSNIFFRLKVTKNFLTVVLIAVTYRGGISFMIFGQIITEFVFYFLSTYYTKKMLDYSLKEQFSDIISCLVLAGIMGAIVYSLNYLSIVNSFFLLILQLLTGIFAYTILCYIFRIKSFVEIVELLKSKLLPDYTV